MSGIESLFEIHGCRNNCDAHIFRNFQENWSRFCLEWFWSRYGVAISGSCEGGGTPKEVFNETFQFAALCRGGLAVENIITTVPSSTEP